MKRIKLTKGEYAIVDDIDFEELSKHKWFLHSRGYAVRNGKSDMGENISILMHIDIMGRRDGFEIDHINRDKLCNIRSNLRFVTNAQNNLNRGLTRSNKSGYKGVHYYKPTGKWCAMIRVNGKTKNLGYFNTPEEAADEWDRAAQNIYGPYALMNKDMKNDL